MEKEILKDLVAINTIKDYENTKFREYIKKYLEKFNFSFEEIGTGFRKVLIAKRNNATIGFICHTDTVGDSKYWTKEALKLTEDETYYYGLGVSDMKGGIAALLAAVARLETDVPCMLCFTYDEECEFGGVKDLLKAGITLPKTLVFTEPTDLQLVIANKGCLEFKVEFKGRSAHSSTPDLGDNALYKALAFINELRGFALQLEKEKEPLFEVNYTTFNLSKMVGGEAINKVPDSCIIAFDFRTIKKEHNLLIKRIIKEFGQKYGAKVEILTDIGASLNNNSVMIERVKKIINVSKCVGLNYATEASFFTENDIFILGPGPVTAHEPDEKISKESYKNTINIYQEILMDFAKSRDK